MVSRETAEIKRPFPLVQDLFSFAEKHNITSAGIGAQAGDEYVTMPLPEEYRPLVEAFPGKYFVTAYEDRRDSYYKENTRHQLVRLSTVQRREDSDARTREMDLKLASGGRADRIEVRVREAVKDQAFEQINKATGEQIEQPHGEARYTYELDENGKQYPKKLEYSRLDEGLFDLGGKSKPVRWVRRLNIDKNPGAPDAFQYQDMYIIGRNEGATKDQRAEIKVTLAGDLSNPKTLLVEIGFGSSDSAKVIFEDKKRGFKFVIHTLNPRDRPLEILKDDVVYAELLKDKPNVDVFIQLLQHKIEMLQDEWDKPQSVYSDSRVITEQHKQIDS